MEGKVLEKKQRYSIAKLLLHQKHFNDKVLMELALGEEFEFSEEDDVQGQDDEESKQQEMVKLHEIQNIGKCGMTKCIWNVKGICNNNGIDLFDKCSKNNFKFYEEHKGAMA